MSTFDHTFAKSLSFAGASWNVASAWKAHVEGALSSARPYPLPSTWMLATCCLLCSPLSSLLGEGESPLMLTPRSAAFVSPSPRTWSSSVCDV